MEQVEHLAADILPLGPVRFQSSRGILSPSSAAITTDHGLLHDHVDLFQQQALQPEVGDVNVRPHDLVLALDNLRVRGALRGDRTTSFGGGAAVARHDAAIIFVSRGARDIVVPLRRSPLADRARRVIEHIPHLLEEVAHAREAGGRAAAELTLASDSGHALAEAL